MRIRTVTASLIYKLISVGVHIGHTTKETAAPNLNYICGERFATHFLDLSKNIKLFDNINRLLAFTTIYRKRFQLHYNVTYITTHEFVLDYIFELAHFYNIDYCIGAWHPGLYSNRKRIKQSGIHLDTKRFKIKHVPDIIVLFNRDQKDQILYEISAFDS
jgi:ribosomal protein S2